MDTMPFAIGLFGSLGFIAGIFFGVALVSTADRRAVKRGVWTCDDVAYRLVPISVKDEPR